jgi:hypothetical protein
MGGADMYPARLRGAYLWLSCIWLVFLLGAGPTAPVENKRGYDGISLSVAVLANSCPTRLLLTVRNDRREGTFRTGPIEMTKSVLLIKRRDGPDVEHSLLGKAGPTSVPIVVKASESRTWSVDISDILSRHGIRSGTCEVRWKLDELTSNSVAVFIEAITLSIALVQDCAPTVLAFTLQNRSDMPIRVSPPCSPGSPVIVVTEGGEETAVFVSVDIDPNLLPVITPRESSTWRTSLKHIFVTGAIKPSKSYRIFWQLRPLGATDTFRSPSILVAAPQPAEEATPNR